MTTAQICAVAFFTLLAACGGPPKASSSLGEGGAPPADAGASLAAQDAPGPSGDAPRATGTGGTGGAGQGATGGAGGAVAAGGAGGAGAGGAVATGGAGGGAVDGGGADAPRAGGDGAAPAARPFGQWLITTLTALPCSCGADGVLTCPGQLLERWDADLTKLCAGRAEGAACSGLVEGVSNPLFVQAFMVSAGRCLAGRCCPGCVDNRGFCRVSFEGSPGNLTLVRTVHKAMDYTIPTGHDWRYFCGSGGEACMTAVSDAEGRLTCKPAGRATVDSCPDKILP